MSRKRTILVSIPLVAFFILLMSSCGSKKNIIYFQDIDKIQNLIDSSNYEIKIKPHDNLLITVSATNAEAADNYNIIKTKQGGGGASNLEWLGYLVDDNGDINFPTIGRLHIGGLTKVEAADLLQSKITQLIDNPVVNIRFLNYKIYIMGEVSHPGLYTVSEEKISVPEALTLAGDMTIYGNRHNVLIIRIENGEKKFYRLDMTSASVFFSEAYYLRQNDILYIEPNQTRVWSSTNVSPYLSIAISSLTFLLTLYTFFSK
jgi:polysaccharide export outer membrane protein